MSYIHRSKCLVHYGQVALWDKEDKSAYPSPEGPLPWVGVKGICVAAPDDCEVDIFVATEPPSEADKAAHVCLEATFLVGCEGLQVGNVTTASVSWFPWAEGRVRVSVYSNGISRNGLNTTFVWFVLRSVD